MHCYFDQLESTAFTLNELYVWVRMAVIMHVVNYGNLDSVLKPNFFVALHFFCQLGLQTFPLKYSCAPPAGMKGFRF